MNILIVRQLMIFNIVPLFVIHFLKF